MRYPQSIGDILPSIIDKLGLAKKVKETQIVTDWSKIVGETIAKHCRPVKLDKGYLTINVDSSPWLNELSRYSKGMILKKVKERLGSKSVRDIRFRIGELEQ